MINITLFMRRPVPGGSYSVERIKKDITTHLSADISIQTKVSCFYSQGLLRRFFDAVLAIFCQSDLNHVFGDVHFLTYFLSKHRTILTILDCRTLERLTGIKRWVFWFFWFWLAEKRCAAIVVISSATKDQLLNYLQCEPEKIRVIHCNVSDEFQASPKQFNSIRPRLLQIGTGENKNIERLSEAIEGLECELVIVGNLSNAQRAALEKHSVNFVNRFRLSRDELLEEYRSCDILVFVSTYEGFGLPIVEANAIGRPVITSNVLSMPEVAGNAACLVNPFDVTSIRAGIHHVIHDSMYRKQLVRLGFINVERFRTDIIAAQYAELYREIHSKIIDEN